MQDPDPNVSDPQLAQVQVVLSRAELAQAITYWGAVGDGGEPGLSLPRQASALVTVLALMDFAHESEVALPAGSSLAQLAHQAQSAAQAAAPQADRDPATPRHTMANA